MKLIHQHGGRVLDSVPPFKVAEPSSHAHTAPGSLDRQERTAWHPARSSLQGPERLMCSRSLHPPAMQGCARADAVVAESGSDRRIKCLLARVTGIPVLKRSFLDRSVLSVFVR